MDNLKREKQELEKQVKTFTLQEKSITEIETKKIRLNAQKEILDNTYQECLNALQLLQHEKIIKSLLKKVNEELPEAVYIYSNNRDKSIVKSLSSSITKSLGKDKFTSSLILQTPS